MSAQVATQAAFAQMEANPAGQAVDTFKISSHGSAYSLDGKESERMNWHHESIRLSLGGLYPCQELVRRILAPSEGETKRVLDLGCGSRIWCLEMAKEFPEAEVWGVDRPYARRLWTGEAPSNCHFETHNSYDFLSEHEARYDLIHMRFVAGGCTQFIKTLGDIQACLKPGGLFILIDSTGDLLAEDGTSILRMKSKRTPTGSRLRRMFFEVHNANCHLGFDENMMFGVLEDGLWEWTELKHCRAAELLVPIGPWNRSEDDEEEKTLRDAGLLMQQSLRTVQPGHESVLRSFKFDEAVMSRWRRDIDAELRSNTNKTSLDVRVLWGRRPLDNATGDSDSLEEDATPTATPTVSSPTLRVPSWHVYNTAEEWKAMLEKRTLIGRGNAENIVPFVQKRMRRPMRRNNS